MRSYPRPFFQDSTPAAFRVAQVTNDQFGTRIAVAGEIDMDTAAELDDALTGVLDQYAHPRLELDLREVSFIDSSGLRTLISCHAQAARRGCALVLTHPQPAVHQVLLITNLLALFGLSETAEAGSALDTSAS